MIDQLKFRIWSKTQNKHIDPNNYEYNDYYKTIGQCLIDCNGNLRVADYPNGNGDNSADSVFSEIDKNSYVIQQYTGRNDVTGVEIYTYDIVEFNDGEYKNIGYVKLSNGIFYLIFSDKRDEIIGLLKSEYLKVVGNLLKTQT